MPDLDTAAAQSRRVALLEDRAVRAATRQLDARLAEIAAAVRVQAPAWRTDPAAAMRGRRALAGQLRAVRPGVAAAVRAAVVDAVRVGAGGAPVDVDPLTDPLIRAALKTVDAEVRAKARTAAALLTRERLSTSIQVRDLADRILAVASPGEATASQAVVRAVNLGAREAAQGVAMVWVTRPGACVHCTEMAGSVAKPGALFVRRLQVADRVLPWADGGLELPPAHPHCRCSLVPQTRGLADALAKNAARDLAEGKAGYMSAPAKARAARRLLASRAPLNPAMRRRAAKLAETINRR